MIKFIVIVLKNKQLFQWKRNYWIHGVKIE